MAFRGGEHAKTRGEPGRAGQAPPYGGCPGLPPTPSGSALVERAWHRPGDQRALRSAGAHTSVCFVLCRQATAGRAGARTPRTKRRSCLPGPGWHFNLNCLSEPLTPLAALLTCCCLLWPVKVIFKETTHFSPVPPHSPQSGHSPGALDTGGLDAEDGGSSSAGDSGD